MVSGGVVMSDWVMVTRGFVVWSRKGVTRGVGMTRGVGSCGVVVSDGVVMSGGVALTSWVGVTIGVGADRGNHLSQLEETVVTTMPVNPRTATMI